MPDDQAKDKPNPHTQGAEFQSLKSPDAAQARAAGASDMAAVEANRSNPSSGSLQDQADLLSALDNSVKIIGAGTESSRANPIRERDLAAAPSPYHEAAHNYLRMSTTRGLPVAHAPETFEAKMAAFGHALIDRAAKEIGDPRKLVLHAKDLGDKFHGVWDGLNEAKEEVKKAASEAFSSVAKGTKEFAHDPVGNSKRILLESEKFGEAFANRSQDLIMVMSKDPAFVDKCFKAAVEKCGRDLQNYSSLSPYEQGKVIGKVMFGMINPEGETGQLIGKGGELASNVAGKLRTHLTELGQLGKGHLETILSEAQQAGSKLAEKLHPRLVPAGAHGGPVSLGEFAEPVKMAPHKPGGAGGGGRTGGGGHGADGGHGAGGEKPHGGSEKHTGSEVAKSPEHVPEKPKPAKITPYVAGGAIAKALSREWLPHSGITQPIYRIAGSEEYLSSAEVSRRSGWGTRNDLVGRLTDAELKERGLERVPVGQVDLVIARRLEKAVLKHLEGGEFTREKGLAAADDIREILRPFCANIDQRNIAFAVVDVGGEKEIVVAINRDEAVPGTMPKPDTLLLKPAMDSGLPRNSDSEFKILEPIAHRYFDAGKGKILLFSEQNPCDSSCARIISSHFIEATKGRISIHTESEYIDQNARLRGVAARVEKRKNAK